MKLVLALARKSDSEFRQKLNLKISQYQYLLLLNVFISFREREIMSREGAERETHTESEAGSRLWAVSTETDVGLEPMNREIMTWAEVRRLTYGATQAPLYWGSAHEKGEWTQGMQNDKCLTYSCPETSLTPASFLLHFS